MSSIDFFLDAEFASTATGLTAALVTSGVTTNSNIHDCEAGCDIGSELEMMNTFLPAQCCAIAPYQRGA